MSLRAGRRLGPYEVEDLLGAGGMGEVYRARDPRLGREVAVKVLPSEVASDSARLSLFEREARAVAALNHPNILTVHDVGTHEGAPYVVTELLEGETLRELVSRRVPTTPQILSYMLQAARGLEAAHAKGIVHRDLKPENLFLTTDGRVKVLDFGLAKLVRSEAEITSEVSTAAHSTPPGQVAGTVLYMSPEQARAQAIDVRSDVFSFGVVLHELLAGKHPFRKDTVAGTLTAIVEETPPLLESLGRGVPAPVAGIVRRCLEKDRGERYASGREVVVAFEAVLAAPSATAALREVDERSPYPGLSSFTEEDASVFFGREREVEGLWKRIRSRKLLAVIGPSGVGKTSFVRAGIVAGRPEGWAALVCTPGPGPMRSLARALAPELLGDPEALIALPDFEDSNVAVSVLTRWRRLHGEALLVVDQFEELFTLNPPEVQGQFAGLLRRLATETDIHVLLSLRDDFLMKCHDYAPLAGVFSELTPLGSLSREDLQRALVEPARKLGYAFEDEALVEEMLDAVEGARAALPLLAFAVSRLWENRDRENKLLTREAYEDVGGVAGALAQHAEQTLDRIGADRHGIVREVFRNLVTAEGTRASIDREELLSAFPEFEAAAAVLDELIGARLLTSYEVEDASPNGLEGRASSASSRGALSGAGGEGSAAASGTTHRIEIVHESLLKAWPRLVWWQSQDEEGAHLRDQLKQAARLWEEKERSPDLLWTGSAYQEFEVWRRRYPGQLTAVEDDFATAMVERSRRRRRQRRAAVVAGFLILAGVAAAVTVSRHQVATSRDEARAEALRAESAKLLALAQARLDDDPTEALALTTASLELADTEEARAFVMKALWEAPPSVELKGEGTRPREASFSPDGSWLAAAGHTGEAAVWREDGTGPIRLDGLTPDPQASNTAGWTSTGYLVTGMSFAWADSDHVHVWSLPEGEPVRTVEFGASTLWSVGEEHLFAETPVEGASFLSGGLLLRAWRLPDGEAELLGRVDPDALGITRREALPWAGHGFTMNGDGWLYARGRDVYLRPLPFPESGDDHHLGRHSSAAAVKTGELSHTAASFSRDGSGEIRWWSVDAAPPLRRVIARPATAPERIVPDPSGRWVAGSIGLASEAKLWDLEALPGARPLTLRRSGSWYLSTSVFHPRANWFVVSTHGPEDLTFWPLKKTYPAVVDGYTGFARPLAFSPDGRWLATSWPADGRPGDMHIQLWPLPGNSAREVKRLRLPELTLWQGFAFDPRGRYLFAVGLRDQAWVIPLDDSPPTPLPAYSDSTFLRGAAVSPSGRFVATAFLFGEGERTLRVWNVESETLRTFDLPESATERDESPDSSVKKTGYERAVSSLHFADDSTLYTAGDGGIRRWDLEAGSHETVLEVGPGQFGVMEIRPGAGVALVRTQSLEGSLDTFQVLDLETRQTRPLPEYGVKGAMALDSSGSVVARGSVEGPVRVGRLDGGAPHLLVGHEGPVQEAAISPGREWIASAGQDDTLRLWPMPDLEKPPIHTLPHDKLLAKLKSLTNLRAVRDPESGTGWTIEVGPFPGWKEVPEW